MAKVFILNDSAHDFSDARRFGEIVFLSKGKLNRYAVNGMHREFSKLEDSEPDDWLLLTGLSIMSAVAAAIFAAKHKKLNLLLFKDGRYIERKLVLR